MRKHLKEIKETLIRSHFIKNIVALTGGTAAAQFLPLLALPFLSRIYSPEAYGNLALFVGLVLILVPLYSLELTQGILYAKSKKDALRLLFGAHSISLFFLVVFLIVAGILIYTPFFKPSYNVFLLIPFASYFQNLILSFINFFNRINRFSDVSIGKISNAVSNILLSVLLALLSYLEYGLILSYLIAQIITIGYFIIKFYKVGYRLNFTRIFKIDIETLKKYKEYPRLILPSSFINVLINHIPSYILGYYYNTATVGYFNRSRQVLSVPISQIATSIGDVFKQEANQRYIKGLSNRTLFLKTGKWLLLLSLPFLLIIVVFGPELFTFAFGEEWIISGQYSQILIFLFVLRFINTPLGSMYFILEKYSEALLMNIFLLVSITFFLLVSSEKGSGIEKVLAFYTIGYSLSYVVGIIRTYQFSKEKRTSQEVPA